MSLRALGALATRPLARRAFAPSVRRLSAAGGGTNETEAPQGAAPSGGSNPFSMVEKLGREAAQKAQEAAQSASQSIGDLAQNASAGPLLQNLQSIPETLQQNMQNIPGTLQQNLGQLQGGAAPLIQNLQGAALGNASQLTQQLAPLLTTVLVLARTSPGQPLTEAQQAKLAEVLPGDVQEMFQKLAEAVPEDPQLAELRRIADSLANIEMHLAASTQAAPAGASTSEAKSE